MEYKKLIYCTILGAMLLLSILAACTETEEVSVSDSIAFGVTTNTNGRAATLIGAADEASFRTQPFVVFGDWKNAADGAVLEEVFDKVSVVYDGKAPAPSGWNYTPIQRWKTDGWYDFRAYWPASNPIENTSNAQTLALEYNMQIQNEDLMVAYKGCPTKSGEVNLEFRHALAAVSVKFISENQNDTYHLKNYYFKNLYYTGTLAYSHTDNTDLTGAWRYAARGTDNLHLREWTHEAGVQVKASADDFPEEFNLFLPQSLQVAEGAIKPSITFTFDVKKGNTTIETPTITVALPDKYKAGNEMIWQAGKKYTYVITIKPEAFDITVRTTQWDEVNVSVGDIEF